jgi:hypothetical protein
VKNFTAKSPRPLPTQAGYREALKTNLVDVYLPPITRPEKSEKLEKKWWFFFEKKKFLRTSTVNLDFQKSKNR